MVDPIVPIAETPMTPFQRHKFFVLVGGTIAISLILVCVALTLYVSNGTEQLDLSRPGYQSISKKAAAKKDFDSFSSEGPLDKSVANDFSRLYDTEAKRLTDAKSFSGDPIGATISPTVPQNDQGPQG